MRKKNTDKKNIIITILAVLVIASGVLNIIHELKNKDFDKTKYYNLSYILISDADFSKKIEFNYDTDYIKVNLLPEENKLEITPIKEGNTTLKIAYTTNTGEEKNISHEISVHSRLFSDIDNN